MQTPDLAAHRAVLDLDGVPSEFVLRPLDLDLDLDMMHSWMNDPEVARFWNKPWPKDKIAIYLREQQECPHSDPYLGVLDGVAMSYWELYRADLDALAQHYPARDHDAGIHMLLGPAETRGQGLAVALLRAVSDFQLATDPHATRVVGEPDLENVRCIRVAERAGFHHVRDLDLPHKRAALLIRDREQ